MSKDQKPEATDWSSTLEQQIWFDKFKLIGSNNRVVGINFHQFQEFLKATVYSYLNFHQEEKKQNDDDYAKFSYQQEMQLFGVFDTKNDHLIDFDEFASLCQNWLQKIFNRSSALVIVDVQNDFIDGSLALINGPANQDGADVVPVINAMLTPDCPFQAVVYTQDWHPTDHIGFHDNLHLRKYSLIKSNDDENKESLKKNNNGTVVSGSEVGEVEEERNGKNGAPVGQTTSTQVNQCQLSGKLNRKLNTKAKVFDIVLFDEGKMEQKLWPVHCVQNSWGAELHPKLIIVPNAIKIFKGTLSHVDAYSAFWDNMRLNETGLRQELLARKIDDVFFCGLALDYCVAASAMDSIKAGFNTFVIEDACKGIDQVEMNRRKSELLDCGILFVKSRSINGYLRFNDLITNNENNNNRNNNNKVVNKEVVVVAADKPSPLSKLAHSDRELVKNVCFKKAFMNYFVAT